MTPRGDQPGIGFALLAGGCCGLYLTLTRRLAGQYPAGAMLFSQLLCGSVILAPLGLAQAGSLAVTRQGGWRWCWSARWDRRRGTI